MLTFYFPESPEGCPSEGLPPIAVGIEVESDPNSSEAVIFRIACVSSAESSLKVQAIRFAHIGKLDIAPNAASKAFRMYEMAAGGYLACIPLTPEALDFDPASQAALRAVVCARYPRPTAEADPFTGAAVAYCYRAVPTTQSDGILEVVNSVESGPPERVPLGIDAKDPTTTDRGNLARSCFFWMNLNNRETNDLLDARDYTYAAGAGRILLLRELFLDENNDLISGWGSNTAQAIRQWIDDCALWMIDVGAHVFPSAAFAVPSSDFCNAENAVGLYSDRSGLLQGAISSTATSFVIDTDFGTACDIRIGHAIGDNWEIFRATKVTLCSSGSFCYNFTRLDNGASDEAYSVGAAVERIYADDPASPTLYAHSITTDQQSEGCATIAASLEAVADADPNSLNVGFKFVYTDEMEDVEPSRRGPTSDDANWLPIQYSYGKSMRMLYDAMGTKPLWMETSASAAPHSWELIGIAGQTDYTLSTLRINVDCQLYRSFELAGNSSNHSSLSEWQRRATSFVPKQLGWAKVNAPSQPTMTPDEVDYIMERSWAWSVPVVFQIWLNQMDTWPNRDANLELMRLYENVRLSAAAIQPSGVRLEVQQLPLSCCDDPNSVEHTDYMLFAHPNLAAATVTWWMLETTPVQIAGAQSSNFACYKAMSDASGDGMVTVWPKNGGCVRLRFDNALAPLEVHDVFGVEVEGAVGSSYTTYSIQTRAYLRFDESVDLDEALTAARAQNCPEF